MTEKTNIFISHAGMDNLNREVSKMSQIVEDLVNQYFEGNDRVDATCKCQVVGEKDDVVHGDIKKGLKKLVDESDIFLAVLSKNYKTAWCIGEAWQVDDTNKSFKLILKGSKNDTLRDILPDVTDYNLNKGQERAVLESLANSIYLYLTKYVLENKFRYEVEESNLPVIYFSHPAEEDKIVSNYSKRLENILDQYCENKKIELIKPGEEYYEHAKKNGKAKIILSVDRRVDIFIQILSQSNDYINIEQPQNYLRDLFKEEDLLIWMLKNDLTTSELRNSVTIEEQSSDEVKDILIRMLNNVITRYAPPPADIYIDYSEHDPASKKEADKLGEIIKEDHNLRFYKNDPEEKKSVNKKKALPCHTRFLVYGDGTYHDSVQARWRESVESFHKKKGGLVYVLPPKNDDERISEIVGTPEYRIIDAQNKDGVRHPSAKAEIEDIINMDLREKK